MMLKRARSTEELAGFAALRHWRGAGAVRVLAHSGDSILMPRAFGGDLTEMAYADDAAATQIICDVAMRLHASKGPFPQGLATLDDWFVELGPTARKHGGILARAEAEARALLSLTAPVALLHGDLHHANVLNFGGGDWRVIDAKGLTGDPCFDYAVLFSNPDLDDPDRPLATRPRVADARLALIAGLTGHPARHILRWTLAFAGLSAAWFLGDDPVDDARLRIDLATANWAASRIA